MQWRNDTTLPSRGLRLRPVGKSLGLKSGKAQNEQCFSGLPPKADFPILELLPPPAFCERRHGGLARRLVAVRWHAVLVITERERPHPRLLPARRRPS